MGLAPIFLRIALSFDRADTDRNSAVVRSVNTVGVRCAYRLVSARCVLLQFVATMNGAICSTFQSLAVRCSLSSGTFNPEVAGSSPARPVGLQGKGERHASKTGVCAYRMTYGSALLLQRVAASCGSFPIVERDRKSHASGSIVSALACCPLAFWFFASPYYLWRVGRFSAKPTTSRLPTRERRTTRRGQRKEGLAAFESAQNRSRPATNRVWVPV
jgi:hypothetical protein